MSEAECFQQILFFFPVNLQLLPDFCKVLADCTGIGKIELLRNFCKGIVLHTKHDDLSVYIWQSLYKLLYPRLIKQLILEWLNSGMVHGIGRQFSIIFFYLLQR